MGVGVEGHGDAGVPKALLDDLRVHAVSQQFARMEVPQIVKAILNAGLLADGAPTTLEVRRVHSLAHAVCEDNRFVGIRRPEGLYRIFLLTLVLTK